MLCLFECLGGGAVCVCVSVSRQMLRPAVWCAMRRVCVCYPWSLNECVYRLWHGCVHAGVGGWVFLGKGIKKTNDHDAMTQFCWVVLICTVQCSC